MEQFLAIYQQWLSRFSTISWWELYLFGAFTFCCFIQFFYILFFFNRIGSWKKQNTERPKQIGVSVIVCVRNRLENLKLLVPRLLEQDYPLYEIILVDDRSNDETYDWLLEQRDLHGPKLRLSRLDETPDGMNEKKYALTIGIKAAKYEYVLLTDDDCLPNDSLWIAAMAEEFKEGKQIVAGYCAYRKYPGLLNSLIRFETFFTGLQYLGLGLGGSPYMGVGRNLSYTRSLFFDYKGFYRHISINGGDDDLFVNRTATPNNYAVCISPEALVLSEPKHSFKAWVAQKKRHFAVGKYYTLKSKFSIAGIISSYIGFWLIGYLNLLSLTMLPLAGVLFFLRQVILGIVYWRAGKKLSESFGFFSILLLDWLYLFCYLYFGISGLFAKHYAWSEG